MSRCTARGLSAASAATGSGINCTRSPRQPAMSAHMNARLTDAEWKPPTISPAVPAAAAAAASGQYAHGYTQPNARAPQATTQSAAICTP